MRHIDYLYTVLQRDIIYASKNGNLARLALFSGLTVERLEQLASGNEITMDEYLALNSVRSIQ